jgi:hypothetical protein
VSAKDQIDVAADQIDVAADYLEENGMPMASTALRGIPEVRLWAVRDADGKWLSQWGQFSCAFEFARIYTRLSQARAAVTRTTNRESAFDLDATPPQLIELRVCAYVAVDDSKHVEKVKRARERREAT